MWYQIIWRSRAGEGELDEGGAGQGGTGEEGAEESVLKVVIFWIRNTS